MPKFVVKVISPCLRAHSLFCSSRWGASSVLNTLASPKLSIHLSIRGMGMNRMRSPRLNVCNLHIIAVYRPSSVRRLLELPGELAAPGLKLLSLIFILYFELLNFAYSDIGLYGTSRKVFAPSFTSILCCTLVIVPRRSSHIKLYSVSKPMMLNSSLRKSGQYVPCHANTVFRSLPGSILWHVAPYTISTLLLQL